MISTPYVYVSLLRREIVETEGFFGIHIEVAGSNLPNLESAAIQDAVATASRCIQAEILAARLAANPESQAQAAMWRKEVLGIFEKPIFMEVIPNGYCREYCCRHLPWFVVTTKVGRITIGLRKRVISLNWKGTQGTETAEALFPEEDVTKDGYSIHAWSILKAKQYVDKIIKTAKPAYD